MNKRTTIKITLQSDLCVGSGYSYAGVIDSDVTSDRYGFPYIPARRLKGCMREAAEMIRVVLGPNTITALFGDRGQKRPGGLMIGNARIANYALIAEAAGDPAFHRQYTRDTILQQFSSVRAQTMINADGTAKDNSLRFIRVINQASPLAKPDHPENLSFYAEVSYPEEYENDLAMIVQATRSIGMNRNRGLGHVRCELNAADAQTIAATTADAAGDDEAVEIRYILTNEEPLMISMGSDNVSETYIPGRMILGSLAANYLDGHAERAEDTAFRDLFLNGSRTQFLNAYITNGQGERCVPVPGYIRRLKKTKHLVNYELIHMAPGPEDDKIAPEELATYEVTGGNQPKTLAGKYCVIDRNHDIQIRETERQLTYHHRHQHGDEEVQLYSHLEVTEGQSFVGIIRTSAAYKDLVISLLEQGLQIGKSRSAQYGKCATEVQAVVPAAADLISVHKGDDVLVSLSAPAVLLENGQELTGYEQVYEAVARDLGIDGKVGTAMPEPDGRQPFGMIDTGLIYGYQSVWNLRRTPVAAISAGSVLVYHMEEDVQIDRNRLIGSMQLEGCGEIHVENMVDLPYRLKAADASRQMEGTATGNMPQMLQALTDRIDLERRLAERMKDIRSDRVQNGLQRLTASALGRITLMLREARESGKDCPGGQYSDYLERIDSIKTEEVKRVARQFAEKCNPENLGDLSDYWSAIALEGLTCQKYLKKQKDLKEQKGEV